MPGEYKKNNKRTHRSIVMDGEEIEFSEGFTDLHTIVYKETLSGKGFGLEDALPSIVLAHDIRNATATGINKNSHPMLKKTK
jgi:UDP-N-acetyl-2-amino-2-deoxyglucuronate dehydrogenase